MRIPAHSVCTAIRDDIVAGVYERGSRLTEELLARRYGVSRVPVREALRTTERWNFLVFAYVGLVLMLVQGLLYRRLVQRVGEVRFLQLGIVLMALGLGAAVGVLEFRRELESSGLLLPGALAVMTAAVIGFAFLTPSVQALISRRSDPRTQGEILGVNQSASALARILGPMLGVSLFFATPSHILPYLAGAVLLVVVFLLALTPTVSREKT